MREKESVCVHVCQCEYVQVWICVRLCVHVCLYVVYVCDASACVHVVFLLFLKTWTAYFFMFADSKVLEFVRCAKHIGLPSPNTLFTTTT